MVKNSLKNQQKIIKYGKLTIQIFLMIIFTPLSELCYGCYRIGKYKERKEHTTDNSKSKSIFSSNKSRKKEKDNISTQVEL